MNFKTMHYFCMLALCASLTTAASVWPKPLSFTNGSDVLWINSNVKITYTQVNNMSSFSLDNTAGCAQPGAGASSRIVQTAVDMAAETLFKQNFVPWRFHPRMSDFEPSFSASRRFVESITLKQNETDPVNILKPNEGQIDEGYSLTIPISGDVLITSSSSIGLARGLNTFTQLFYAHTNGEVYSPSVPVSINDRPQFVHRGLNMDTSRNYYPVATIMRTIDALAYNKFNRFHWHITDAQSWPLVIPSMPELSAKGAYRADYVYTPDQLSMIAEYGALRGVEVYIEIDMPGHTSSIWFSHPELIAAYNVQPDWDQYAAEPPSGTLKLNSSAVTSFIDSLLNDLLPRQSALTSFFHTGGDEVKFNAYTLDDTVRSNSSEILQPLLQAFVDRAHKHVRDAGLTPIVWEEILLTYNLTLPSDVIIQSWIDDVSVLKTVQSGHRVLVGNYNFWYLDCGHGQFVSFSPGSESQAAWPYNDYCAPFHNWREMYSLDPLNNIPGSLSHLVLGGEVHVWSEQIDDISLDRVVWPRVSAAGEVLWSGAIDPASGTNRSQVEAAPRLAEMRERLVARGVAAETMLMPFCSMSNGLDCVQPAS